MIINFATCERKRALEYIRKVYPSKEIQESDVAELLDFVEKDYARVQDPMMYGNRIAIIPGKKFRPEMRKEIEKVCKNFIDTVMGESDA